jgi:hydroxyacylglutathione hydrolase
MVTENGSSKPKGLIVLTLPVGIIQTNCYVAGCEETKEAVIIDPGGNPERILAAIKRQGLAVQYVLNTHAHFDHTDGNKAVVEATGAALAIHALDRPLLEAGGGGAWFGMGTVAGPAPTVELKAGDPLAVGKLCFEVLHTPGHTPGHVCFFERNKEVLFDGDVLFCQGVGRADLPGGDWQQLMDSIQRVLFALPDETVVYPGHGPATTIGEEKRSNPWLR